MKKLAVIFLSALFLATSVLTLGVSAIGGDVWDGTETTVWYDGTKSTLTVSSAEDLCAFVTAVNGGNDFAGKTVELACDISWNKGDASKWNATNTPANKWIPIGTFEHPFNGTFDGKGYIISGLYVNSTDAGAGFFGYVSDAVIKDLHIENSYIGAIMTVGSVVGHAAGDFSMSGCTSDAYVVMNYSGKASDSYYGAGGLVGQVNTSSDVSTSANYTVSIENCAFTGSVLADNGLTVGGIVGYISGGNVTVDSCLAEATVTGWNRIGGIIGRSYCDTTVSNCYSKCKIYVWSTKNYGAVLGSFRTSTKYTTEEITVTDCYYAGEVYENTSSIYGLVSALPTRLGSNEYSQEAATGVITYLGAFNANSTYYTDSANDNSTEESGNQTGLSIKAAGGFDAWFAKMTAFSMDAAGNVYLKELKRGGVCETINIVGASVRIESPAGIRFLTKIDKDDFFCDNYNGDDANYEYDGADIIFGTLVIPLDMLGGTELTVDTDSVADIEAKKLYAQNSDMLMYTAVLYNYPERTDTYNRELAVRSYAKYKVDGEYVYVYSDTLSTSFYKVAKQAYADEERADESVKKGLNLLLALGSVSDDFYADDLNRVQILEYADEELFYAFADALTTEGYEKHTSYEYSDNLFGVYKNEKYVVTFYYTPKTIGKYTEVDQHWYGNPTYIDDMDYIADYVNIEDKDNILRVIVEKSADVDLPVSPLNNAYTRIDGMETTLAQLYPNIAMTYPGMGYVIQLADGSYIIIDGGEGEVVSPVDSKTNGDHLYEYLHTNKPAEHDKPVIAAWILTHRHGDHVGVVKEFIPKYKDDIVLEQMIYNFSSDEHIKPFVYPDVTAFEDLYILPYIDTKIITAHTGYKFYIRNATVSILYSVDDFAPNPVSTYGNNESIAFDVVIDGVQRIMFTGEIFIPGSRALVNMYGADIVSDAVQISHHGNFGATAEVNSLIWPESKDYTSDLCFALLPNGNLTQSADRLDNPENQVFKDAVENDGAVWLDKLYAQYEMISEYGSLESAYGKWQTIKLYQYVDEDSIGEWPETWN